MSSNNCLTYFLRACALIFFLPSICYAQVDLPSGRAQVDLPLYNYSDGDKLATNVNLVYTDGAGIKVNKVASDVGLGWELQSAGSISRITRGEPDDQKGGVIDGELFATGNLYTPYYSRSSAPYGMGWIPIVQGRLDYFKYNEEVIADRQQDEFIFQFGNRSGRFVIDKEQVFHILDDSRLKIEKIEEDMTANGILTRISKFVVTDESGVRYTFNEKETSRIISYQNTGRRRFYLNPAPTNLSTYIGFQSSKVSNYSVVNCWKLTEIADPKTGKKISFTYDGYNVDYISSLDAVETISPGTDGDEVVAMKVEARVIGSLKRITGIALPDDSKVKFTYAGTPRVDLSGANALLKIAVERDNKELLSYQFVYQYFSRAELRDFNYSFPTAELPNARLCLNSVTKTGNGNLSDNPYRFNYYISSPGVPGRLAAGADHWGYYNLDFGPWDTDENQFNNLKRIAYGSKRLIWKVTTIRQGLLKSVQYPTGGSLNYDYENNTAFSGNKDVLTGGLRVKKITYNDGVNASPDIVKEFAYTTEDGKSSGWGYEEPKYTCNSRTKFTIPTKGTFSVAGLARDLALSIVQTGFYNYSQYYNPHHDAEGLTTSTIVATLIMSALYYVVSDIFFPSEKEADITATCNSSLYAKLINPLPGTYSRVTAFEGDISLNRGKTVYEFTTDKDFPILFPNEPQAGRPRYISGLYGLLKRKRTYNRNNEIVSEEYNKYDATTKELNHSLNYSVNYEVVRAIACPSNYLAGRYHDIIINTSEFYPLVGRPQLRYKVKRSYNGNSTFNEVRTDFTYDTNFNLKKEITVNSLGEKIERRIYYPYDYNIPGILTTLKTDSILSVPVSSETWLLADGTEDRLIGAEISNLTTLSNGAVKPDKMYRLMSKTPVPKSVIGDFRPDVLIRNTDLMKAQEQMVYDGNGNIVESVMEDRIETNIYDDRKETLIAKIMNAAPSDVAFSSFERRAKGTWTITPSGAAGEYLTDLAFMTGSSSLNLAAVSSLTKTGLNSGKKYILSYWTQGGTVSVSGGSITNETIAAVHNGWTLKTMIFSGTASISINGTGNIDELRLHPVDATMITQTYDEFKNLTSITNATNTISYYEYDGLGRILYVKDADGNIIHAYEYQYK
ncbi:MAG TPA: RHS repeat domain-containing protein [Chitinophaga sp.]|uniref:RHS repeat protein n=1 Tax=Chitinophaga sp. TaxID=1869181 RepID=UPI002C9D4867|nr:RHS repeat domain-containing protein [Chitinophaga sp.]HVI48128.1 RHS repeat domain-containing protein [Chitinophaga sp.]